MKHSFRQLLDLSDEILLIIFEELNNVEMLNSLMGINARLDQILRDPIFTEHLTLMKCSSNAQFYPLVDIMLDRFCSQILPQIHHNVKWLSLESSSMERILRAVDYPNLYGLGLCQIGYDTAVRLFSHESDLVNIFRNQITKLDLTIDKNIEEKLKEKMLTVVYTYLFTVFTNLIYLNLSKFPLTEIEKFWNLSVFRTFTSTTLMELHVNVNRFNDCLYLLDGRFDQLRSFYVKICIIMGSSSTIDNKKELRNLKCFSLISHCETSYYDELILPLLHRMSNLERLTLCLLIHRYTSFIDGNQLKKDIINQLQKLNKFLFNICSFVKINHLTYRPSNEDIQRTFIDFNNYEISCCVNYFLGEPSQCHIYTYPFRLKHYDRITNNFPDRIFKYVEKVSLFDERPFEHEFFMRLAKAFPFLKDLHISNRKAQNEKLNNDNRCLPVIEYPHLVELSLSSAHETYVEQFLMDTKTCLSNDIYLQIDYKSLVKVTNYFTNEATRINCAKLECLHTSGPSKFRTFSYDYFPHLKRVIP